MAPVKDVAAQVTARLLASRERNKTSRKLSGGREYATTPSADPFRLPRPIRSTALARFGLDFDDGAAHARAALAVIAVHRELAAEFLWGETREKVLVVVGAALLPGAEPTESRKAVKGLFCATEMDGTYSAWRTRNDIPEDRSLGGARPDRVGGGRDRRSVRNGLPNSWVICTRL